MENQDKMKISVLPDGTIKIATDVVSAENHATATEFFKFLATKTGGEVTTHRRSDAVHEHHDHTHSHEHN